MVGTADPRHRQPLKFGHPPHRPNVAGLQWQSKKVFIGGVLLGITTGALVTLMTSVLGTADKSRKRRLQRRFAEAHGGKEANAGVEK